MVYVEASVRRQQFIAAARTVLAREGVARTTLRAVAAEAEVPLGTLQYVFPSKELLFQAVIEDVVGEIAEVSKASAETDQGLGFAIEQGVTAFWSQLVASQIGLQLMQYELTIYAMRTPGQEGLARWQYERYAGVVADWCQRAAQNAGETCAVPFGQLARVLLACVDGLILQYVVDPNASRAQESVDAVVQMLTSLAGVRRAPQGAVASTRN